MSQRAVRGLLAAVFVAGTAGAVLLFLSLRDPCTALLRRYAAVYDAAKTCRLDADCVLDPLPPGGPGVCDRARAAGSDRAPFEEVERAWTGAACPVPGRECPPIEGARCQAGRCVTLKAPALAGPGRSP
jgi:hypothetical protein